MTRPIGTSTSDAHSHCNPDNAPGPWTMNFDGSFALNSTGAGVVLTLPTREMLMYIVCLDFKATNNMATLSKQLINNGFIKDNYRVIGTVKGYLWCAPCPGTKP